MPAASRVEHAPFDFRNRGRRFLQVDGDAHHFRTCLGQLDALFRGGLCVRRIRHRHRLHDHGRTAAHLDVADTDANGFVETGD